MLKPLALVLLCGILSATLTLMGQESPTSSKYPMPGSRLRWYADRARERGEKSINIEHGVGNPPDSAIDLISALTAYDVVTATLVAKQTEATADDIFTWYKFRITSTLHRAPRRLHFPNEQQYPNAFGRLASDEFAFEQAGGTTQVNGITIKDMNSEDEPLLANQTYMVFVNRAYGGIAVIPGAFVGIYQVSGDRLTAQDHGPSRLADDIHSTCHNSWSSCYRYLSKHR